MISIRVRIIDALVWFTLGAVTALLFVGPAWAGSITVTVNATADQELAVTTFAKAQADAVTKRNADAVAWNAANPTATPKPLTPVLTREQWLADQVSTVLSQLATQHRAKVLEQARDAFLTLPSDQRPGVCSSLRLKGKLTECP